MSERLKDILEQLGDKWGDQVAALQELISELRTGQTADQEGLPPVPEHYLSFLRLLLEEIHDEGEPGEAGMTAVVDLTAEIADIIAAELTENFWRPNKKPDQDALATRLFGHLVDSSLVDADAADALVDKLMDLACANHRRLMDA